MKTTKILETEKGNTDAVHLLLERSGRDLERLRQIGGKRPCHQPGTPHADGRSDLDGTEVTHLKVTTEQFERYGLADYCVAVDDERLKLKIPVHG